MRRNLNLASLVYITCGLCRGLAGRTNTNIKVGEFDPRGLSHVRSIHGGHGHTDTDTNWPYDANKSSCMMHYPHCSRDVRKRGNSSTRVEDSAEYKALQQQISDHVYRVYTKEKKKKKTEKRQSMMVRADSYFFWRFSLHGQQSALHCLVANAESKISKSNVAAAHPNRMSHHRIYRQQP